MSCPNKNTPEWKELEKFLGTTGAYKVFVANGYELPTGEKLKGILSKLSNLYDLDYDQVDITQYQNYVNQLENYEDNFGTPPSKKLKETVEKLLTLQGLVGKTDKNYVVKESGKTLERATDFIKTQDNGYYAFEADEDLYENNRIWGNQIDFIFEQILLGADIQTAVNNFEEFVTKNNQDILVTEDVFLELYKQFQLFKNSFPGSVILTQVTLFNEEKELAGTADIVIVHPNGDISIYDLKSSVNPTNYNPITKQFEPYQKGSFTNRYDKPFIKKDNTRKASKKEMHQAQLSIYKGLAISNGFTFPLTNDLGIFPVHITKTSGNVVTEVKKENMFGVDANQNFLDKAVSTKKPDSVKTIQSYSKYDKLLNEIKILLENRLIELERNKPNPAEKFIINKLKEKLETTEKTKAIVNFITDVHQLFIGNEQYPGELDKLLMFLRNVEKGTIKDSSEIIDRLLTNKKTIDTFRPIVEDIQGFLNSAGIADLKNAEEGSLIDMCNKLIGSFNAVDTLYKDNINTLIAAQLAKEISPTANTAHIKEIQENERILATLDPESRAYKIRKKRVEELKNSAGKDGVNAELLANALDRGSNKDMSFLDYLFSPIINANNPILALFAKTYKKLLENNRQRSIVLAQKSEKFFSDYAKYAESNGASRSNVAEFNKPFITSVEFYDSSSDTMVKRMSLVQEIDLNAFNKAQSAMFKRAKEMTDPEAKNRFITEWYLQNTEPLPENDVTISVEGFEKPVVIQKGRKTIIEEHRKLVQNKSITQAEFDYWLKQNQIEINGKMYFTHDFSLPSKSKYASEQYKKIQSNPNLKKYYNFLIYSYFNSQNRIPEGVRKGYVLPSIAKSDNDRFREQGAINYLKNWGVNLVKFTEKDQQQFGESVEGVKVIPVLYTNNMPAEDVSLDLMSSVLMFDQSSLDFKAAVESVSLGEATLKMLIENPPAKTDALGQKMISQAAKIAGVENWQKYLQKTNGNNLAAALAAFIDMQIYGIKTIEAKASVAGKVVDLNKLSNNLMGFASFTQIGGNPIGSVANALQAQSQALIEAASGDFFNEKELVWAEIQYNKNIGNYVKDFTEFSAKSQLGQIIELYDPMQGNYKDRYGRKVSMSALKKAWSTDAWFFLQNAGEHAIQVKVLLAMLKRQQVKRIVNGKTETISLYNAYELGPDGVLKLKDGVQLEGNISENGLINIDLQNSLHAINKRMHGVYNEFDRVPAQRNWAGRLLLMYKKFFIPGLKKRYKNYGLDQELGLPTEGYYNTFFRIAATQLKDMLAELSPFNTTSNLTPLEKKNLSRATRELALMLSTGIMVMILRAMGEADDEERKLLSYSLLFSLRLNQELMGFINPIANYKVVKNPMAVQSVIEKLLRLFYQLGDPLETYEKRAGYWEKGDYKLVARLFKLFGLNKNLLSPEETIKQLESYY